jgi:AraC-like DNA-binding protein
VYAERPSLRVPGAVLWRSGGGPAGPVLPDGCMDLLWVDGRLLVAGPDTRPHPAREVPGAAFAGIRFGPGAAPALLGVPADVLRDRRVELADLWPAARVRALAGRVAAYADPLDGLEALAAPRTAGTGPFAAEVVARLRAGEPVAAVARAMELSPRTLHRRSLAAFGYGAKTLDRVLRFQRALALLRAGVPAAAAAQSAGYADQAHLVREFRALSGGTPARYAPSRAKRETPQPSGSATTA